MACFAPRQNQACRFSARMFARSWPFGWFLFPRAPTPTQSCEPRAFARYELFCRNFGVGERPQLAPEMRWVQSAFVSSRRNQSAMLVRSSYARPGSSLHAIIAVVCQFDTAAHAIADTREPVLRARHRDFRSCGFRLVSPAPYCVRFIVPPPRSGIVWLFYESAEVVLIGFPRDATSTSAQRF